MGNGSLPYRGPCGSRLDVLLKGTSVHICIGWSMFDWSPCNHQAKPLWTELLLHISRLITSFFSHPTADRDRVKGRMLQCNVSDNDILHLRVSNWDKTKHLKGVCFLGKLLLALLYSIFCHVSATFTQHNLSAFPDVEGCVTKYASRHFEVLCKGRINRVQLYILAPSIKICRVCVSDCFTVKQSVKIF